MICARSRLRSQKIDLKYSVYCFGFGGCGWRCFGLNLFNFIREARCQHHGTMLTNILSTHAQCRSTNIFTTLALKYLYAHQIFFRSLNIFPQPRSRCRAAPPRSRTSSTCWRAARTRELSGTVLYIPVQYSTVQYNITGSQVPAGF